MLTSSKPERELSPNISPKEREFYNHLKREPEYFVRELIGDEPYAKQIELMNAVRDHDQVVVSSCNGAGKDFISARITLWWLLTRPSIVITSAPTNRQVEQVMWGEIRSAWQKGHSKFGFPGECLTRQIKLGPKWYALGFSTDEESMFQGFHEEDILVIFSEAQGMTKSIYQAAKGCLTSNSKFVLIGNPLGASSEYYEAFRSQAGWHKIKISAFDTPNFTTFGITLDDIRNHTWQEKITSDLPYPALIQPKWVAQQHAEYGEQDPFFVARVLGEFPDESEDSLISLRKVLAAVDRKMGVAGNRVLGCDVARYGSCETVVCDFDGYTAKLPIILKGANTTQSAGAMIDYMRENKLITDFHRKNDWKVYTDDVGVGGGVTDVLKDQGYDCKGLIANAKAEDTEKFFDLRMEAYWILKEMFEQDRIAIPNDQKLISQLTTLKFEYTSRGQRRLISKEKLRKEGQESPDRADALALAAWGWTHGGRSNHVKVNFSHMMAGGRAGY